MNAVSFLKKHGLELDSLPERSRTVVYGVKADLTYIEYLKVSEQTAVWQGQPTESYLTRAPRTNQPNDPSTHPGVRARGGRHARRAEPRHRGRGREARHRGERGRRAVRRRTLFVVCVWIVRVFGPPTPCIYVWYMASERTTD